MAYLSVLVYHTTLFTATAGLWDRVIGLGGSAAEWALALSSQDKVGVPLFFVVSGYCIAAAAESVRTGSYGVRAYFARRVRRIYPPYWNSLAAFVGLVAVLPDEFLPGKTPGEPDLLPHPGTLAPAKWLGAVTLTEEWRPPAGGPPKATS